MFRIAKKYTKQILDAGLQKFEFVCWFTFASGIFLSKKFFFNFRIIFENSINAAVFPKRAWFPFRKAYC